VVTLSLGSLSAPPDPYRRNQERCVTSQGKGGNWGWEKKIRGMGVGEKGGGEQW